LLKDKKIEKMTDSRFFKKKIFSDRLIVHFFSDWIYSINLAAESRNKYE